MSRELITTYSDLVPGDRGNYDLPVCFDRTGKYIGITQLNGDTVSNRILLSPKQVRELLAFLGK